MGFVFIFRHLPTFAGFLSTRFGRTASQAIFLRRFWQWVNTWSTCSNGSVRLPAFERVLVEGIALVHIANAGRPGRLGRVNPGTCGWAPGRSGRFDRCDTCIRRIAPLWQARAAKLAGIGRVIRETMDPRITSTLTKFRLGLGALASASAVSEGPVVGRVSGITAPVPRPLATHAIRPAECVLLERLVVAAAAQREPRAGRAGRQFQQARLFRRHQERNVICRLAGRRAIARGSRSTVVRRRQFSGPEGRFGPSAACYVHPKP